MNLNTLQTIFTAPMEIGVATNAQTLACLLKRAIRDSLGNFSHWEPLYLADSSTRILYQEAVPGSSAVTFSREHSPEEIAADFFKKEVLPTFRFPPPEPPTSASRKGWSVRKAFPKDNTTAVIVILSATWVD